MMLPSDASPSVMMITAAFLPVVVRGNDVDSETWWMCSWVIWNKSHKIQTSTRLKEDMSNNIPKRSGVFKWYRCSLKISYPITSSAMYSPAALSCGAIRVICSTTWDTWWHSGVPPPGDPSDSTVEWGEEHNVQIYAEQNRKSVPSVVSLISTQMDINDAITTDLTCRL